MRFDQRRLRLALVVLLASAAVLLAVGAIAEHHQPTETDNATPIVTGAAGQASGQAEGQHSEPGWTGEASEQGGEAGEDAAPAPAASSSRPTSSEPTEHTSGEQFLGVAESLPLTIVAVGICMALAVAVWARPARLIVWIALGVVLLLAAADGRELAHHLHEARAGLATIAAVLLGVHLATAGVAVLATRLPAVGRATAGR